MTQATAGCGLRAFTGGESLPLRPWAKPALEHKRGLKNHPRQSPTIYPRCPYFPVLSSPTATLEVVGNTGNASSEKGWRRGSNSLPGHQLK